MGDHSLPGDEDQVDQPPARMNDIATSLIRTWVPIGVGAVVAWGAASQHIIIPPDASAAVGAFAATIAAAAYYALARLLERARPAWLRVVGRYMLGGVVPPVYLDAATSARILR